MEQKPYGDPDFDPEHNRRVIAEVDAYNDMMDRKRDRDHKEEVRERAEASADYLKQVAEGRGMTSPDKYFGRRYLAHLRGQQIVKKLQANPALVEKLKQRSAKKGTLGPL